MEVEDVPVGMEVEGLRVEGVPVGIKVDELRYANHCDLALSP